MNKRAKGGGRQIPANNNHGQVGRQFDFKDQRGQNHSNGQGMTKNLGAGGNDHQRCMGSYVRMIPIDASQSGRVIQVAKTSSWMVLQWGDGGVTQK